MNLYDEYCYNLMESAIKQGAEGNGLKKDECVAYMNIMFGARGVEDYIKENGNKESYGPMTSSNGPINMTEEEYENEINSITTEEFKAVADELAERAARGTLISDAEREVNATPD